MLDQFVDFVDELGEQVGDERGPWEPYVPQQSVVDVTVEVHPALPFTDCGR